MQTRAPQRGEVFRELAPDLDVVGEFSEHRVRAGLRPALTTTHFGKSCHFANIIYISVTSAKCDGTLSRTSEFIALTPEFIG
jgi:hypothetical protein